MFTLASGYFVVGCSVTVVLSHLLQQKLNYCLKDNCLGFLFICLLIQSCSENSIVSVQGLQLL